METYFTPRQSTPINSSPVATNLPTMIIYDDIDGIRQGFNPDDDIEEIEINDVSFDDRNPVVYYDIDQSSYPLHPTAFSPSRLPPPAPPRSFNFTSKSTSATARNGGRHHSRRHRTGMDRSVGNQTSREPEYWVVPRPMWEPSDKLDDGEFPAGHLFPRNVVKRSRSDKVSRSSRNRRHHRSQKYQSTLTATSYDDFDSQATSINGDDLSQINSDIVASELDAHGSNKQSNKLMLYFRFQGQDEVDYLANPDQLSELQARCRGWLARCKANMLWKQHQAVRVIQRNARLFLDPWFRLLLKIRPLIDINRSEQEKMSLASELERYKWLVRLLRSENNEQQKRISDLIQLLNQLDSGDDNNEIISVLVNQMLECLDQSQSSWAEMTKNDPMLSQFVRPTTSIVVGSQNGQSENVDQHEVRSDAIFYQNQFDVMKEEADEQQTRTAEYYKSQLGTLNERVVQLQNQLTVESRSSMQLQSMIDELKATIHDNQEYQCQLEATVGKLNRQLRQSQTPDSPNLIDGREGTSSPAGAVSKNDLHVANQNDQLKRLSCLFGQLHRHLSQHPTEASKLLANTPFEVGGELDLVSARSVSTGSLNIVDSVASMSPLLRHRLQSASPSRRSSPGRSMSMIVDTERATLPPSSPMEGIPDPSKLIVALRRQLTDFYRQLNEKQALLDEEIDERERVESENTDLHDKVTQLSRELRRARDEHDDLVTRRDLTNDRRLSELGNQLDDERQTVDHLKKTNLRLSKSLAEMKQLMLENNEEDIDEAATEVQNTMRLRNEMLYYKHTLAEVREQFDQFVEQNNPERFQEKEAETTLKVDKLEQDNQHFRMEIDVLNVKLQNTNRLLEESENRIKSAMREKLSQLTRIQQLESERDAATRESALVAGRAQTDKDTLASKSRELDTVKLELDQSRRELVEIKKELAGRTGELSADKRQLEARLRELERHFEARINDLKVELDRSRQEGESLQAELQSVTASEKAAQTTAQSQKWRLSELEEDVARYRQRLGQHERQSQDLEAELSRVKSDLNASRELASARRMANERLSVGLLMNSRSSDDSDDGDLKATGQNGDQRGKTVDP